ncbi:hypothetical protein IGI04_009590 [Brassica rapa subsp. trilocularis]|uniref:Uncharacterized protein n=1 Tax=Brassica rapa subsp. trilocularis TaxID=1813537 RepID=A0ABQ7MXP6_BRACM|nr:hypothetical protein IGI04_009590 [Brassica rapa subsp. trilocularis]
MAATGRSRTSSVLCRLSSPEKLLNHHQRPSASLCNINLRLKSFFSRKHSRNLRCVQVFVLSHGAPWLVPVRFSPPFRKREEQNPKFTGEAKQVCVEADRVKKSLAASMVTPSPLHISRRFDFRPRPSRFYALRKDQDLISSRL